MREAPETTGEPLTLHRHDTEGPLGGAVYSAPFAAYLGQALHEAQRIECGGNQDDWWRNAYLAKRLRKQMMTYPEGGRAYLAILAIDRNGMPQETAAERCGHDLWWLKTMLVRFEMLRREYCERIGVHRKQRRHVPASADYNLSEAS